MEGKTKGGKRDIAIQLKGLSSVSFCKKKEKKIHYTKLTQNKQIFKNDKTVFSQPVYLYLTIA